MVEGKGRLTAGGGGREIARSRLVLASQSEWIVEEISTQILHTTTKSLESSYAQVKEPRSKSKSKFVQIST